VEIDQARIAGQKFESERRSLSEEQRLIKENLSWLRDSTAFGASIRAQLQRLPNQIQNKTIPDEIANAHIRKYEISQLLDDFALEDAVRATQSNAKAPDRLETLSHELIEQLSQDYEKLIIALGKLQLTINQYAIEVENARAFLREQQLWTRSNVPFWQHLTDFNKEIWFGTKTPLKTLQDEVNPDQLKMVGGAFVFYTL
ncbi:mechanosensitive ion channel protein MscS, partial [Vibrio owensii]